MQAPVRQSVSPLLTGAIFATSLPLFLIIAFGSGSDVADHAEFIRNLTWVPLQIGYYYAVAALSLFSSQHERILIASSVLLSLALSAKYHVTVTAVSRRLDPVASPGKRVEARLWAPCLGLLFVVCLPLPGHHWYLGQFPPNVWHNSTTIALMPFAVLLFFSSAAYLDRGRARDLRWTVVWTLANGAIKPSLLMAFGPVFPLLALWRFGWRREFFLSWLPALAVGTIGSTYYLIGYLGPRYDAMPGAEASVVMGWFFPWREFSSNIPLSAFNSLLLPSLFLAVYPRQCSRDPLVRYAAALLTMGLVLFSFFHETSNRALHGNFIWQTIIANYLLHVSVLLVFLRIKRQAPALGRGDRLLVAAFLVEVLAGLVYLGRLVIYGTYV